jgi:hypothetical protein
VIQLTPHMRVLVAVEPADFRCGIDGLVRLCRERLGADPFSGAVFVFRNRRKTAVKLVVYDGQGFWLAHNYSGPRVIPPNLHRAVVSSGRLCIQRVHMRSSRNRRSLASLLYSRAS